MRIAVSNDHAGLPLKAYVLEHLRRRGHDVIDVGTDSDEPVDFPLMTRRLTDLVRRAAADRGVLVCGTGVGAAIAANKVPGIRAALAYNTETAELGRAHNDAQVVAIGGRMHALEEATAIVDTFLATPFSGDERHARRIRMMADYERTGTPPPLPS